MFEQDTTKQKMHIHATRATGLTEWMTPKKKKSTHNTTEQIYNTFRRRKLDVYCFIVNERMCWIWINRRGSIRYKIIIIYRYESLNLKNDLTWFGLSDAHEYVQCSMFMQHSNQNNTVLRLKPKTHTPNLIIQIHWCP